MGDILYIIEIWFASKSNPAKKFNEYEPFCVRW